MSETFEAPHTFLRNNCQHLWAVPWMNTKPYYRWILKKPIGAHCSKPTVNNSNKSLQRDKNTHSKEAEDDSCERQSVTRSDERLFKKNVKPPQRYKDITLRCIKKTLYKQLQSDTWPQTHTHTHSNHRREIQSWEWEPRSDSKWN